MSDLEVRVLGALLEKERTTPESYPLSTNALLLACNQKTSRDPVLDVALRDLEETLRALQTKGLVRSEQGVSERVVKHRQALTEGLGLRDEEVAVLAVLMLRGPQTPGELRGRTDRYVHFADTAAVEACLARLEAHGPPLARNLGRGAGQSQDRWDHTLGPDPERSRPRARRPEGSADGDAGDAPDGAPDGAPDSATGIAPAGRAPSARTGAQGGATDGAVAALRDEVGALRDEIASLRERLARLAVALGVEDD